MATAVCPFAWEDATAMLERIPALYSLWWGMRVRLRIHSAAVPDNGYGGYCDKAKACWHPEGWNYQTWLWWREQIFPWAGKKAKIRNVTIALMFCDLLDRLVSLEGICLVRLSVYQNHWPNKKTNSFGTHIAPSRCSVCSSSWHIRKFADLSLCINQGVRRE